MKSTTFEVPDWFPTLADSEAMGRDGGTVTVIVLDAASPAELTAAT